MPSHLQQALQDTPASVWRAASSVLIDLADGTPVIVSPEVGRLIAAFSDYALGVAESKE